jgi:hypothetical protein
MSLRRRALSVLLLALSLSLVLLIAGGCDKLLKSNTDPLDDLVGSWYATSFLMVNPSNPAQQIEEVAQGLHFTLVITADGHFTAVFIRPEEETEVDSGTISTTETDLTITPSGDSPRHLTWSLSGEVLTLVTADDHYDWNDDNIDEPANLTIVLHRSDPGPALAELNGTWSLDEMVYVDPADPMRSVEVTDRVVALVIRISDGTIDVYQINTEDVPEILHGTFTLLGDLMIMDFADESAPSAVKVSRSGGLFLLEVTGEQYDWDEDGEAEPVVMRATFSPYDGPGVGDLTGFWTMIDARMVNPVDPEQTFDILADGGVLTFGILAGGGTRRIFAIRSQNQYLDNDFILENHGPVMEFHNATGGSGFQAFRLDAGHFFLTSFIRCDWDQDGNYSEPGIRIMELEPVTDIASTADLDTAWSASAMVYWRAPDWTESFDIIPVGGAYELDLHPDLTYVGSKTLPGEDPVVHNGHWEIFGNLLILHDEVAMDLKVLEYHLNGEGDLTLWRYVDHYDFDGDGTDEPAVTEIHLYIPTPGY